MSQTPKSKRKRAPETILKLPDLEQSKSAVVNSLTSPSSQRSYDHAIREFIHWYCSEPGLAFNKTVVTRYRLAGAAEVRSVNDQPSIGSSTSARL
jgi:ferritin